MNNFPINRPDQLPPIINQFAPPRAPDVNQKLVNSYDGFIRGNMFTDLYDPWISGEPFALIPQSEREALLNKYREYNFALIDIGLYLDVHPNDTEKIAIYNQYKTRADQTRKEYELRYGPLTLTGDNLSATPWTWLTSPWSWEGK